MTSRVKQIAEQVKALDLEERQQFLAWLAEFELDQPDPWDEQIARDSQRSERLQQVIDRARRDIAEQRIGPLDEVISDE